MGKTSTYAYGTDVVMNDGTTIRTTVTNSGDAVKRFLKEVYKYGQRLIVGLDTEWQTITHRDSHYTHRMAVLQLCVGHRCLVFQIACADYVPAVLKAFLAYPDHSFVGVGVDNDVERLYVDCKLLLANPVDLRYVAAEVLSRPELRYKGLKALTCEVMGVDIDKPMEVTKSNWSQPLSMEQVQYACIDAFVSYEIGRLLLVAAQSAGDAAATGPAFLQSMSFELP